MTGADEVDHVQAALANDAIPVHIEEVEAGRRAPVAKQTRLYVVDDQWPLKQWIVFEVDLAYGKIVGGAPVRIHLGQLLRGQGVVVRWFFAQIAPRVFRFACHPKRSSRK